MTAPPHPTQRDLARRVAYKVTVSSDGQRADVSRVIDEVLAKDLAEHDGQVFHKGSTPRASARRALYDVLPEDTLLIRDGYGIVRFKLDALRDVIIQGDAWQVLPLIPEGVLSCVFSDAPTDHLEEHRAIGTTTRMVKETHFKTRNLDAEIIAHFYRVLKPGGWLCLWMPPMQRTAVRIRRDVETACEAVGFVTVREVTVKKPRSMGYRFTGTTEPIWAYCKPLNASGKLPPCEDKAATNFLDLSNVWPRGDRRTRYTDGVEGSDELPLYHNTEKPVEASDYLLRVCKDPGGLLLACFAGTGPDCIAAKKAGMDYLAVEYEERAVERLLVPRLVRAGHAPRATIVVEVA